MYKTSAYLMILFSSTLTHIQCDVGFVIFAVFDAQILNVAVNKCIN